jgi:hypothetical protein
MASPSTSSILVLGDADFSYTLDLIRYLSSWKDATMPNAELVDVVATGYDGKEEAERKYKNLDSNLRKIEAIASSSSSKKRKITPQNAAISPFIRPVSCTAIHGINALSLSTSSLQGRELRDFARIIFNHPHLGTEDFRAHSRFLGHLFHSVRLGLDRDHTKEDETLNSSIKKTNVGTTVLHLVFASPEQATRWRVLEMARHQGFALVDSRSFVAPPTSRAKGGKAAYCSHRRGQNGKAFKVEGGGKSECMSFVRTEEGGGDAAVEESSSVLPSAASDVDVEAYALPWMRANAEKGGDDNSGEQAAAFECDGCGRKFAEQRSLKNHSQTCRGGGENSSSTNSTNSTTDASSSIDSNKLLICLKCPPGSKGFVDPRALEQHVLQIHCEGAGNQDTKPHWFKNGGGGEGGGASPEEEEEEKEGGKCEVCCCRFSKGFTKEMHDREFVLEDVVSGSSSSSSGAASSKTNNGGADAGALVCGKCGKTFREIRAMTQHTNCCFR